MRYVPLPDLCSPDPSGNRLFLCRNLAWTHGGATGEIPSCHPPRRHANHSGKTEGAATDTTIKHGAVGEEAGGKFLRRAIQLFFWRTRRRHTVEGCANLASRAGR